MQSLILVVGPDARNQASKQAASKQPTKEAVRLRVTPDAENSMGFVCKTGVTAFGNINNGMILNIDVYFNDSINETITNYHSCRLPPTHVCKTLMSAICSTGVVRGFFSSTTKSASLPTSKLPILSSDINW